MSFLHLHNDPLGLAVQPQAHIAHVDRQRVGAAALQRAQLRRQRLERLDLGLGLQGLDLDRAMRLDDLLIGRGLRQADIR
jgi:hypothetical protein